ncbi:MAG: hypothetical protein M1598_07910 [Actinobacteria bacterium]|nr:hypothetical protein [Actinomycetota bacterium]
MKPAIEVLPDIPSPETFAGLSRLTEYHSAYRRQVYDQNEQDAALTIMEQTPFYQHRYHRRIPFEQGTALMSDLDISIQVEYASVECEGTTITVNERIVRLHLPRSLSVNDELERMEELRSDAIFRRPELEWSPEARIAHRENENRRRIAEVKGESPVLVSISDVKRNFIERHGEEAWGRLIERETRRLIAERWYERQRRRHPE